MQGYKMQGHGIEALEVRQHLSVSVSLSGSTLDIIGDSSVQRIQITDSHWGSQTTTRVAVDTNRNGRFTDAADLRRSFTGVTRFNLDLKGGTDIVDATLSDPYSSVSKTFYVRGGAGNDRFNFKSAPSLGLRNASLAFDVDMGSGNDRVNLFLDDVAGSTVSGRVVGNTGDDRIAIASDYDVRGSSVNLAVSLGDGNDSYLESHDVEGFDLLGASSLWRTVVRGGNGLDTLQGDLFGVGSATLEGTYANQFFGDADEDHISQSANSLAVSGTLRLRQNGGDGADDLWLDAAASGSGTLDLAVRGYADADRLQLTLDAGGTLTYADANGAILDGGDGSDVGGASGTGLIQVLNVEAAA